jgi:hypothetical protein
MSKTIKLCCSESLQRFGFNSYSIFSRALFSLSKRDIATKNKVYHIQNVMLKKWILITLPALMDLE